MTDQRSDRYQAVVEWGAAGGFFESILAGLILGFGLDWWLNTEPWFVIGGIVAGAVSGFTRMYVFAKKELVPRER